MMYAYEEINQVHLEITSKCNAACPLCARTDGDKVNSNLPIAELNLEKVKKIFSDLNFIRQLKAISLCGNFGDPIMAKDFLKIVSFFKQVKPTLEIMINTNGSIRNAKWWKLLASMLTPSDLVIFSIDGLEDTNHIYRKNTNWDKIMSNAKAFLSNGGRAYWEYIVFKHNEHQIDLAAELSSQLGFEKFILKRSSRYNRETDILPPVNIVYRNKSFDSFMNETGYFLKDNSSSNNNFKDYVNSSTIKCKVLELKSIFITSEGYIHPCCWIGLQMYSKFHGPKGSQIWSYINQVGLENLNCINKPIKEILEGPYFQNIKQSWSKTMDTGKLIVCAYTCGNKYDFFSDQYFNYKTDI